jgi:hypothetical protein
MNTKLKYTTEQFIEEAKKIHGDKFDYSETIYDGTLEKIIICCKTHGSFLLRASSHLEGQGCRKCGYEKSTIEDVIEKAREIHGHTYDYSKSIFTKMKAKSIIICPIHGEFLQDFAMHIDKKSGCPKCGAIKRSGIRSKKIRENLIDTFTSIHGETYDYSKFIYQKASTKSTIICKIHGEFLQSYGHHASGQGCPICGQPSHWSRSDYIKKANGRECTFYTLRCFNEEEEFYKIGITMNSVKERYKGKKGILYEYEVINEVKGSAGFIWDLELEEKRKLKGLHYQPKLDFAGSATECFTNYKI